MLIASGGRVHIQRSIVRQRAGDTKTKFSNRPLTVDVEMLAVLKRQKQRRSLRVPMTGPSASQMVLGCLRWSANAETTSISRTQRGGRGRVSTHSMKQTYRS